jgi:sugar phosphate isomerase/epimerase
MISRRNFIQTAAISSAVIALNPSMAFQADKGRKLNHIGYIAGIIGNELKGDWKAALAETVKYGYTEIEIDRYRGESAKTFLKDCSDIGIKPIAGGAKFSKNMEDVNKSLDNLNDLELKYAVIYWPWMVGGPFTFEDCKISADLLNQIGEVCKNRGLQLCWHNHNKEFIAMEDGLPFDYIMVHTDKDLVKCEMDLYWVQKGGADPLTLLKKYKNRYAILHVKDMAADSQQSFADVGSGVIDFPSIFSEAYKQGIEHYFVEKDNAVDGLEALNQSAKYLKNLIMQ